MAVAAVTATTNMGAGVVRDGGLVVFVPNAVEGDVIEYTVTRRRASFCDGELVRVITPSRHRAAVDCGAFCDGCGGCAFRHVSYEHELDVKRGYISSCLRKHGIDARIDDFLTAGPDAVRSKITVPIGSGVSGYYARGSHRIVPSRRCLLHDELADSIRNAVADARLGGVHHVTVRRASDGVMAILRADAGTDADRIRALARELRADSVYLERGGKYELIAGAPVIYDTLSGCRFRISPESFYQVNHDCAELLYARAVESAALASGERLADLYCGTGTIGIAAARHASVSLVGVEIVPSAVADARLNARENGVGADFICGDAAAYDGAADCVILDPPRAGCGEALISHLLHMLPDRIVYVSCEPATMARDAARLAPAYRVESVAPVDMFPRTGKVECVCRLARS